MATERRNPGHKKIRDDDGDDDWRREIAMQAGMGLGVEAYNDAMGWGSAPDDWMRDDERLEAARERCRCGRCRGCKDRLEDEADEAEGDDE